VFSGSPGAAWLFLFALTPTASFAQAASSSQSASVVVITGTDGEGNTRLGTGFVADASGTVVTTHRALRGLVKATVRLANGDAYDIARVRAFDAVKNFAIVQVNAFGLATAELGNSESIDTGARISIQATSTNGSMPPVTASVSAVERLPEGFRVFALSPRLDLVSAGAPQALMSVVRPTRQW
jgi:S1-C subfamily serine protease